MAPSPIRRIVALCSLCASIVSSIAIVPGHVEAWGNNVNGRAVPPADLDGVIAIAAGVEHSLAVLQDGTVLGWGNNSEGQTTPPPGLSNVVAVAAGLHSVALKADGTVIAWGSANSQIINIPPGLKDVIAISARGSVGSHESYTLALKSDGTVVAWGSVLSGQTLVPPNLTGVSKISAGYFHALALKNDGTIVGWGFNASGSAQHPPGLSAVVDVAAGQYESIAVKADGTIFRWGSESTRVQIDTPQDVSNMATLQLGSSMVVGIRKDSWTLGWGGISDGFQPVNYSPFPGRGITAISVGDNHVLYLTPRPRVFAITPPVKTTVGAMVTLTVIASGPDLHYQWRRNGADIPGKTEASLVISTASPSDAGAYVAAVTNPYETIFSPGTSISFDPPVIQSSPANLTVYRAETARFSVQALGFAPLRYEWSRGGTLLVNSTNPVLALENVRSADAGTYQVKVIDAAGGSSIASANLAVIDPTVVRATVPLAFFASINPNSTIPQTGNPQGTNTILSGTRNNGISDRAFMQFDLASIPANAVVASAAVRLQVVKIPQSPPSSQFSLFRMLTPWTTAATWFNPQPGFSWTAQGGAGANTDCAFPGSASKLIEGAGQYDFAPTAQLNADVQAWIKNPATNHGWLLKADSETARRGARHFSASPLLILDYQVPAPSPRISTTRLDANEVVFEFGGSPGWLYRLESRDVVDQGPWTPVTSIPSGPATNSILLRAPINSSQRFYRLLVD